MSKRIAMISEHASPLGLLGSVDCGGQNVYVGQIAKHLAEAGYEVDVFTRRDSALLPEVAEWVNGVRIIHVPAGPPEPVRKEDLLPHMDAFTSWMLKFCKRQKRPYDLVHANFFLSGQVAADIKRALGTPFLITFHALGRVRTQHQPEADEFPKERCVIEDRIAVEADRIIAECPQDEEDLIRLYNADPNKISVIPCGFDQSEFSPISKPLARVVLGMPPDERVLVQVGRLVPRKGVDVAIRALARLERDHGTRARLLIVGGDADEPDERLTPEIGRLRAVAGKEGIEDRVEFVGRRGRDALKYYYSAADMFITTPWYEPFGITPVEAMACGTPVIGANVGGIKFTVRDGETGYLVPPRDPDALAERIAHLYRHPKLLSVFRYQATRRVNDLFTWRKVADSISLLYENVLMTHPDRRRESEHLALIDAAFDGAIEAFRQSRQRLRSAIAEAAAAIEECYTRGGKVLICGNGGSAADAQHFVGELVGRFKCERPGLPAYALNADTAILTAWANDVGYDDVFARQVQALGRPGDVFIGISTSGNARNVVRAFDAARRHGLRTVSLLGGDGGEAKALSDLPIAVAAEDTQRIQEVHILVIHLLCELVEERMFGVQTWPQADERVPRLPDRKDGYGPERKAPLQRAATQGAANGRRVQA